jgi:hypothetical protein
MVPTARALSVVSPERQEGLLAFCFGKTEYERYVFAGAMPSGVTRKGRGVMG